MAYDPLEATRAANKAYMERQAGGGASQPTATQKTVKKDIPSITDNYKGSVQGASGGGGGLGQLSSLGDVQGGQDAGYYNRMREMAQPKDRGPSMSADAAANLKRASGQRGGYNMYENMAGDKMPVYMPGPSEWMGAAGLPAGQRNKGGDMYVASLLGLDPNRALSGDADTLRQIDEMRGVQRPRPNDPARGNVGGEMLAGDTGFGDFDSLMEELRRSDRRPRGPMKPRGDFETTGTRELQEQLRRESEEGMMQTGEYRGGPEELREPGGVYMNDAGEIVKRPKGTLTTTGQNLPDFSSQLKQLQDRPRPRETQQPPELMQGGISETEPVFRGSDLADSRDALGNLGSLFSGKQ